MASPTEIGWYGVRMPHPSGTAVRQVLYCYAGRDEKLGCEHFGSFVHVSHARFCGAEWFGPHTTRALAEVALLSRR